jgi:hypothetical protein
MWIASKSCLDAFLKGGRVAPLSHAIKGAAVKRVRCEGRDKLRAQFADAMQNPDRSAGSIHPHSDPTDAKTKHLCQKDEPNRQIRSGPRAASRP